MVESTRELWKAAPGNFPKLSQTLHHVFAYISALGRIPYPQSPIRYGRVTKVRSGQHSRPHVGDKLPELLSRVEEATLMCCSARSHDEWALP